MLPTDNMQSPKIKKVAVVAVHGVGDQQPSDTAHRIGDLLQDLNLGQGPHDLPPIAAEQLPVYYPFHEEMVHIDVRPTVVKRASDPKSAQTRGPFNAWVKDRLKRSEAAAADDQVWYQFTHGQICSYRGDAPEDTFHTIRMEGRRARQDGQPPIDVHVYELYWADLSRLKAGALSVFTELYQLLFHLPSLGIHTVNAAALHHQTADWRVFRQLQSWAAGILTVPIPILNLLMLAFIAVVAAMNKLGLPQQKLAQEMLLAGAMIAIFFGLAGWILWLRLAKRRIIAWIWLAPLLAVAIGAGVVFVPQSGLMAGKLGNSQSMLATYAYRLPWSAGAILALIAISLVGVVMRIYDKRRPGAFLWAAIIVPVILVAGIASAYGSLGLSADSAITFWVREFEICDIALLLTWLAFFLLSFGTLLGGAVAVLRVNKVDKRARRSWWTGLLMLSLPAMVFLLVTTSAWYLLAMSIVPMLKPIPYSPLWPTLYFPNATGGSICLLEMPGVISPRLGLALQVLLFFTGLSLIPAVWGLAPVVWNEVFPPNAEGNGQNSVRLGRWLTLSFQGLFVSGLILYATTMFILPVRFSRAALHLGGFGEHLVGAVATGTGLLGFLLFRGRLHKLAMGFRPVLDILLDIDNWFREHPLDSNPKARIWGRYVSLLRYIANWKQDSNDSGSGYDGIVIIAHSQGTVITADLLRFLAIESNGNLHGYDKQLGALSGIPIYLFTMGCPLRQLYGLRFPHLYHWAHHEDETAMQSWQSVDLPQNRPPMPRHLAQIKLWVNCYRSGDYVGRFLWRTDDCGYVWAGDKGGSPLSRPLRYNSTDGSARLEFCIGAGAHTHYWDHTAPIVAAELDRLIATI